MPSNEVTAANHKIRLMNPIDFHYRPICSAPGCQNPAAYKVAASWSDGTSWELKNYGLACEEHRATQLARGKANRQALILGDGEVVGQVGLFELHANVRDAALKRLIDQT